MGMEVNVSMTAEDFMEFMEWKRRKNVYENKLQSIVRNMEHLANRVLNVLEECGETEKPEYKIKDQAAAAELYMEAAECF